jgi:hypothetical protein
VATAAKPVGSHAGEAADDRDHRRRFGHHDQVVGELVVVRKRPGVEVEEPYLRDIGGRHRQSRVCDVGAVKRQRVGAARELRKHDRLELHWRGLPTRCVERGIRSRDELFPTGVVQEERIRTATTTMGVSNLFVSAAFCRLIPTAAPESINPSDTSI